MSIIQTRRLSTARAGSSNSLLSSLDQSCLYGREEEVKILQQAYERATTTSSCELVTIEGTSGTGKTTLGHTLQKQKGFFLSGSFQEMQKPYAVFVEALTEYANHIYDKSPHLIPRLKQEIQEKVDSEGGLLLEFIPALSKLMGAQPVASHVSARAAQLERFRFVFSQLIKAICQVHPLAIFLDDLQWADAGSLDLVKALLLLISDANGQQNLPLLIVGAHRPIEKLDHDSLPLSTALDEWHSSVCTHITTIELKVWDIDMVNHVISDVLQQSREATVPLARVVHLQTQGNVFSVLLFLKLLHEEGLIYLNDGDSEWQWDLSRVESSSTTELLFKRLRQLPQNVQSTLEVAACMGADVDDSAISLVLKENDSDAARNVLMALKEVADAGLLIFNQRMGGYRFAHDRIRQAALALLDEPDQFRLKVGRRLWKHLQASDNEGIFVVVSLLNRGSTLIHDQEERYRLAELNLRAAEMAIALSAFSEAALYLESGIDLLGRDHWSKKYALSLALYDLAAEVEMVNAKFVRVRELIEQVLENGRSLGDKLRSYATLINAVGQQDDVEEALKVGFNVLDALGEPLPKKASKWAIVKELLHTKWMLRGKTKADFCAMPHMTSESKIQCAEMLNLLLEYGAFARSPFLPIFALRTIKLCVKHGLYPGSAVGFAYYGMMLCLIAGQEKQGWRMAEVALAVVEALEAHEMVPRVYCVVYGLGINHWTKPLRESLEPLKFGALTGMMTGDIVYASICANRLCFHSFYVGSPLGPLEEDFARTGRQLKIHKQENVLPAHNLMRQVIQNLIGKAEDPRILKGSVMDIDVLLKESYENHFSTIVVACFSYALYVAYLFGDYERAGRAAEKLRKERDNLAPAPWWGRAETCFVEGLTAVALAKHNASDMKKNVAIAKACHRALSKWAKNCPSNCEHKLKLLEAELAGMNPKMNLSTVLALYDEAIEKAKMEGFTQYEALACERASLYMEQFDDTRIAKNYMDSARSLYLEWGATAKVAMLEKES